MQDVMNLRTIANDAFRIPPVDAPTMRIDGIGGSIVTADPSADPGFTPPSL